MAGRRGRRQFVLAALEPHFSERVLRLPRAFQPSDNTRTLEPSPSRAECGLPEHGVVFCCFNNSYKLNPRSMGRAFAVLQAVPGSLLWLLSGPGQADARLRTAARAAGLDPARLVFVAKLPHRSTWPATHWPTCSSTRIRTTRTPPPPMHCGPAARC